eukprot:226312_1
MASNSAPQENKPYDVWYIGDGPKNFDLLMKAKTLMKAVDWTINQPSCFLPCPYKTIYLLYRNSSAQTFASRSLDSDCKDPFNANPVYACKYFVDNDFMPKKYFSTVRGIVTVESDGTLHRYDGYEWRKDEWFKKMQLNIIHVAEAEKDKVSIVVCDNGAAYSIGKDEETSRRRQRRGGIILNGHGEPVEEWRQIQALNGTKVIKAELSENCAAFLGENGSFWIVGSGDYCSTGGETYSTPTEHPYFAENKIKIKDFAMGDDHTLVVDDKGNVYSFGGTNSAGQQGNGSTDKADAPKLILENKNIIEVSCGRSTSLLKSDTNEYYLFGWNDNGTCCVDAATLNDRFRVTEPQCVNQWIKNATKHGDKQEIKQIIVNDAMTYILIGDIANDADSSRKMASFQLQSVEKIMNDEFELFTSKYNVMKLKQILHETPQEIVDKKSKLNEHIALYKETLQDIEIKVNGFLKQVVEAENHIKLLSEADVNQYESWNVDQILMWINKLEDKRFMKYTNDLREVFVEEGITGDCLPDIDKIELKTYKKDNKPIIGAFRDRRDLAKHFSSLKNSEGAAETAYV